MFFCCESNKSTLLKPLPRFIYRLIRGFTEVLCNIWNIYQYAKSLIISP